VERRIRGAEKRGARSARRRQRKDVNELWDLGENLDKACEACHRSYWYPGEGAEFYRKLRGRLENCASSRRAPATRAKPQKQ
jgi:hypothetical protein